MKEIINLTDNLFIASGGERDCYSHPLDNTKILKIIKNKNFSRYQNELEYKYLKSLETRKIPFSHIVKTYGFVDTNLGKALINEKICNFDKQISETFRKSIIEKKFTQNEENNLINELKEYIFNYDILFLDVNLSNVLCCEYEKDMFKLILIDGVGTARDMIRANLYKIFKSYTKYKIKKQWKVFINNINKARSLKQEY